MKTQISVIKSKTSARTETKADEQVLKAGLAIIGVSSCAIGIWSAASLVGGMLASGGPVALVANWFKAVIG